MEHYATILRGHGLKVTPQRLLILRYLDEHRTHPTADEIYSAVKRENPSLSRTTIYNTLDALRKARILQALTITETELRYDLARGDMHHHLLCRVCGTIYDVEIACPRLGGMLNGEHAIEEVHGYFKGICKQCLAKQERKL